MKRLTVVCVFIVIAFSLAYTNITAGNRELAEDVYERLRPHQSDGVLYPAEFSLTQKIKEARDEAFTAVSHFEELREILQKARGEFSRQERMPAKKKKKEDYARQRILKADIIPALKKAYALRADRTSVFVLDRATGTIREIEFQEPIARDRSKRKRARAAEEQLPRRFPTYTKGCGVIQYGGDGHGMNLLALCDYHVFPVLALAHFHSERSRITKDLPHVYTPYSEQIHSDELVAEGKTYLSATIQKAMEKLESKKVPSRAFPGEYVHWKFSPDFIESIIINEHMDHDEFNESIAAPAEQTVKRPGRKHPLQMLVEKVFVILGANKEYAFMFSRSRNPEPLRAYGMPQFIQETYRMVYKSYPDARLIKNFYEGMRDHKNAIQAMILLFDRDLSEFSPKARALCEESPDLLEDCLAVAYNGGVRRLNGVIETYGEEWDRQKSVKPGHRTLQKGLTKETIIYLEKLRKIREFEK